MPLSAPPDGASTSPPQSCHAQWATGSDAIVTVAPTAAICRVLLHAPYTVFTNMVEHHTTEITGTFVSFATGNPFTAISHGADTDDLENKYDASCM
ncbi:hypothetical protein PLESTF_001539600 [Pleodorina starrii]|nr:hypothetical protein PLESTM_001868300 [Pleodorina starrii]GLC74651.1 hypothetical protein PLESTF_001539600 [Pleodorina starrii]